MFTFFSRSVFHLGIDISELSIGVVLKKCVGTSHTLAYSVRVAYGVSSEALTHEHVLETLSEVIKHMLSDTAHMAIRASHIRSVAITLSQAYLHTVLEQVTKKSEHPFRVTPAIVRQLESSRDNLKPLSNECKIHKITTLSLMLNGYSVSQVYDRMVKRVDAVVLAECIHMKMKESIESKLHLAFPRASFTFVAPHSIYLTHLRAESLLTDSIMLHIRNESTRCIILSNKEVVDTFDIPYGLNQFYAADSQAQKEESSSIMEQWLMHIQERLAECAHLRSLPKKIVLACDSGQEQSFVDAIASSSIKKLWYDSQSLAVESLSKQEKGKEVSSLDFMLRALFSSMPPCG
jgi:hypothetical protein